jgi:hypothetical protein
MVGGMRIPNIYRSGKVKREDIPEGPAPQARLAMIYDMMYYRAIKNL